MSKKPFAMVPWKLRLSLSIAGHVSDFCRRNDGTVNRRLLRFFEGSGRVSAQSNKGVKVTDVTVDPERNVWFRVFEPIQDLDQLTESTLPVFVFFHGGAFSFLSPDARGYDAVCRKFARKIPALVVSVNYRLSPEHRCPAPYDDGFDTLKFLDEGKWSEFPKNADLTRCFLGGDSAGANLAHHVACRVAETEFNKLKVIGLIAIQPFFGGEERTESELRLKGAPLVSVDRTDWHWRAFLPEGSNRDHQVVNPFGPNAIDLTRLKRFPSTLVFIGGLDPLQDWQRRYYEGLKKSDKEAKLIEYPNAFHAFYVFPQISEASQLLMELIAFVNNDEKLN